MEMKGGGTMGAEFGSLGHGKQQEKWAGEICRGTGSYILTLLVQGEKEEVHRLLPQGTNSLVGGIYPLSQ